MLTSSMCHIPFRFVDVCLFLQWSRHAIEEFRRLPYSIPGAAAHDARGYELLQLVSSCIMSGDPCDVLRDGGFRFPKPPVYSALISVAEEVIDLSDDEQKQGEVVDADDSARRVATKTDSTHGPYCRCSITCEICGKEANLSEHKSRAHVPQVGSGRNRDRLNQ